jgi:hypothetical protein
MADPKKAPVELDMSPAETAQELARLRARVNELEARPLPNTSFAITNATEIDAGITSEEVDGKMQEVQWWYYKIDLPPSGGIDIKINGVAFYHGEQYKITTNTLRMLKDTVAKCWKHEEQIHGSNENFYRRPQERVLRGTGR